MKPISALPLVGMLLISSVAVAQNTDATPAGVAVPDNDAVQVVEVSGVKNPELKPYRQMVKGIDAFEKFHALAPGAELRFQLISDTRQLDFNKITLGIAGKNTDVALPVAANGTFTLPRLPAAMEDNADIISNLPKGQLRWRGDIRSPHVPDNARRMGDLRLECEISWAVNREDMPFMTRNSLSLLGGLCHSKMIGLRSLAPRSLVSATLISGERKVAVPIDAKAKRVFTPPLADTSWNDDALVVFEYEATP